VKRPKQRLMRCIEWLDYNGGYDATRFSLLTQINTKNVAQLRIVARRKMLPRPSSSGTRKIGLRSCDLMKACRHISRLTSRNFCKPESKVKFFFDVYEVEEGML
jgi:hypothetical protein